MKKLFIVANWKSNKTSAETKSWLESFAQKQLTINPEEKAIVVCPSFVHLPQMQTFLGTNSLSIAVGAQDVSPFPAGAYTGEVNGAQVKEVAEYVIIGHSERRKNFGETDEILTKKVEQALSAGLQPIFCIQNAATPIPEQVSLVAFEPIEAIGTGHPDTPEDANTVAETVKKNHPNVTAVLYGGSVTPEDVKGFTQAPAIDGVLVGGASLDPEKFAQIIINA